MIVLNSSATAVCWSEFHRSVETNFATRNRPSKFSFAKSRFISASKLESPRAWCRPDGASMGLFKGKSVKSFEDSEEQPGAPVSSPYEKTTVGCNGSYGWSGRLPSRIKHQYRHRIAIAPACDRDPPTGSVLPASGICRAAHLPAPRGSGGAGSPRLLPPDLLARWTATLAGSRGMDPA